MGKDLYKNTYRRTSVRLEGFDYGSTGAYFITICSDCRRKILSEIKNGNVSLFPLGKIILEEWKKTAVLRNYVSLGPFVIMPDHIHGIIYIHHDTDEPEHLPQRGAYLHFPDGYKNKFGPQRKNLASIVRGFKSAVTWRAKVSGLETIVWQKNYYEHIIRNQNELERIELYILQNPFTWSDHMDFPENFGHGEAA